MSIQRAITDILVNQEPFLVLDAIPNKRHKVPMLRATEDLDLRTKLVVALGARNLVLLHSNQLALWQDASVHGAIAALGQVIVVVEAVSGHRQLCVSEFPHGFTKLRRLVLADGAKRWSHGALFLHEHGSTDTRRPFHGLRYLVVGIVGHVLESSRWR